MTKARRAKKRTPARKPPRKPRPPRPAPPRPRPPAPAPEVGQPIGVAGPQFGEPTPSADPTRFVDQKSDAAYYNLVNKKLLQPLPPPRDPKLGPDKLVLTLEEAWGTSNGLQQIQRIEAAGRIVFHAVGDTGPSPWAKTGPETVVGVADKMVEDFNEADPGDVPAFFFHLGDVVYSFGEAEYYYDQFYEPFRNYPAPIFAIPGNHDGVTYKGDPAASLAAFLRTFCSDKWEKLPEAGTLSRTAMIQPSVYFRLDAPFVNIIGLYSNVLEDPGVISSEGDKNSPVSNDQLVFLKSQLDQLKKANYAGAVIVAVHHPPFTAGATHGGSPRMLMDLDNTFQASNFYPHAVLTGHAHNYQRWTRRAGGRETPYIVAGSGGHNVVPLSAGRNAPGIRTPLVVGDKTLETYNDRQYGYLRVVATSSLLSIEFHEAVPDATSKSPSDLVTVDLATRTLTTSRP